MSRTEKSLREENEMVDQVLPQVGEDRMENKGKNLPLGRKGEETKLGTYKVV